MPRAISGHRGPAVCLPSPPLPAAIPNGTCWLLTGAPWPWRLLEGQAHDPIQADFHPGTYLGSGSSDGCAGIKRPTVCDQAVHQTRHQGKETGTRGHCCLPMVGLEELVNPPFYFTQLYLLGFLVFWWVFFFFFFWYIQES